MADDIKTPAQASNLLEVVKRLEQLERAGQLRPAEQRALDAYRAKVKTAAQVAGETAARYRGLRQGATLDFWDEMAGLSAGAFGGDREATRERIREENLQSQVAYPGEYGTGRIAGGMAAAAAPIGGFEALAAKLGLGAAAKIAGGAGTGAALVALPQMGEATGGVTKRMRNIDPLWALGGAALGAGGAALGEAGAYGARAAQLAGQRVPGYTGKASRLVGSELQRARDAGVDIEQYLASLGPEGMIADLPGPTRSAAGGLVAQGGTGGNVISKAIRDRAAGAGARTEQAATELAGEPIRAFTERQAMAAERSDVLGPLYEAAKRWPEPQPTQGIAMGIASRIDEEAGAARAALASVAKELKSDTGAVSAARLHNVRSMVSGKITEATRSGRGDVVAALKPVLDDIDAQLDSVPGYAEARGGWADVSALERAQEAGRKVFTGGATTVQTPEDLQKALGRMTEAQREAFKAGAREYVYALMGTSTNEAAAAWREFGKGFNERKAAILFGSDDAQKLVNRLKAEKAFSETLGRVEAGSQTANRAEAAKRLEAVAEDGGQRPTGFQRLKQPVDDIINNVVDAVVYGNRRATTNRDIGLLMSLRGAERDRALAKLIDIGQKMADDTAAQARARALMSIVSQEAGVYETQQNR